MEMRILVIALAGRKWGEPGSCKKPALPPPVAQHQCCDYWSYTAQGMGKDVECGQQISDVRQNNNNLWMTTHGWQSGWSGEQTVNMIFQYNSHLPPTQTLTRQTRTRLSERNPTNEWILEMIKYLTVTLVALSTILITCSLMVCIELVNKCLHHHIIFLKYREI